MAAALVRREGLLSLAGEQVLQDARARVAEPLSRLQALPGLSRPPLATGEPAVPGGRAGRAGGVARARRIAAADVDVDRDVFGGFLRLARRRSAARARAPGGAACAESGRSDWPGIGR